MGEANTPMQQYFHKEVAEDKTEIDYLPFKIRLIVGKLQWLSNTTRPDIAVETNAVSSY